MKTFFALILKTIVVTIVSMITIIAVLVGVGLTLEHFEDDNCAPDDNDCLIASKY